VSWMGRAFVSTRVARLSVLFLSGLLRALALLVIPGLVYMVGNSFAGGCGIFVFSDLSELIPLFFADTWPSLLSYLLVMVAFCLVIEFLQPRQRLLAWVGALLLLSAVVAAVSPIGASHMYSHPCTY